jgi:hypothetical protein
MVSGVRLKGRSSTARSNYLVTEPWGSALTRSTHRLVCMARAHVKWPARVDWPAPPLMLAKALTWPRVWAMSIS